MVQATNDSTAPKLTGKQAGQVFDIIADAKLSEQADTIEAANEFDRLSIDLRQAEFVLADVVTTGAQPDDSEKLIRARAQVAEAQLAVGRAYLVVRRGLEQLLYRTAAAMRDLDH